MKTKISLAIILLIYSAIPLCAQELEFTEWEKQTFEKQSPERVMDIAGIKEGFVVGEVGAGNGRITLHLAKRVGPQGKVFANDIDGIALKGLKDRCSKTGFYHVDTIHGLPDNPLFPEGKLDVVLIVWTYHWLGNPVLFMKNLLPALKPNAKIIMIEPDPVRGPGGPKHGVSVEKVQLEADSAGLRLVKTLTDFSEDLVFILEKK